MKELSDTLKSRSLKATPQRLAIYRLLMDTIEHPNAETIYTKLQVEYPSMSLATVYKTLDTLTKASLIQELNVGEDSFRYDANTNHHPHLICRSCHVVYDFLLPDANKELKKIRKNISEAMDFEIEDEHIYFYGTCSTCRGDE